jgi:hypothetical protein
LKAKPVNQCNRLICSKKNLFGFFSWAELHSSQTPDPKYHGLLAGYEFCCVILCGSWFLLALFFLGLHHCLLFRRDLPFALGPAFSAKFGGDDFIANFRFAVGANHSFFLLLTAFVVNTKNEI